MLQTIPNQIYPPDPLVSLAMHRLCKSTLWATHLPRSNHILLRANTVHLTKKPLHITRDYQISLRSSRYHQEPPHQTKKPPHQTRKQPHRTMHCYNSKDCLPVLSGSGAVSFRTEWFFFHKMFPRSRKEYFQKLKHSEWFFHSYLEDIPVSNASNTIINIMLNVISVDLAMI
jgi:hypothetical protein